MPEDICNYYESMDREDDDEEDEARSLRTVSFEVRQECVEDVQKRQVIRCWSSVSSSA